MLMPHRYQWSSYRVPSASLWTVQRATHKTNGKAVSIWTFNKDALAGTSKGRGKLESAVEVLKKEVGLTCTIELRRS